MQITQKIHDTKTGAHSTGKVRKTREGIREPALNKKMELYAPLLRLLRAIERRKIPFAPSGMPGQVPLIEVLGKVAEKAKEEGIDEGEVLGVLRESLTEVLNQDLNTLGTILNGMRQSEIGETLGNELGSELIQSLALELGNIKYGMVELSMMERLAKQVVT